MMLFDAPFVMNIKMYELHNKYVHVNILIKSLGKHDCILVHKVYILCKYNLIIT
jgi:hypothetical protein